MNEGEYMAKISDQELEKLLENIKKNMEKYNNINSKIERSNTIELESLYVKNTKKHSYSGDYA